MNLSRRSALVHDPLQKYAMVMQQSAERAQGGRGEGEGEGGGTSRGTILRAMEDGRDYPQAPLF
jgi:hypothetical protein